MPKVIGALLATNDKKSPIAFFPLNGTDAEFVQLDEAPEAVKTSLVDMADANDATVLGVIIELAA